MNLKCDPDNSRFNPEWRLAVVVLLVFPWLNPFAPGPSPSVVPWLLTVICAALLLVTFPSIRARDVMLAWLVAALASCLIALCQYFTLAQYLGPWVNVANPGDAYANLRQRNQFASLTSVGLLALMWWVSTARPGAWTRYIPLVILLAAGNAASASRTGLFQLVLIVALICFWRGSAYREKLYLCAVAGVAYAASAIALPPLLKWSTGLEVLSVFDRLNSAADCGSRSVLWSNVLGLVLEKPWSGWGWGELDYAHYMHLYTGARFCDILDNAHNLPLHIAVELGIPAAVFFIGLVCWLIYRMRPWREQDMTRQTVWGVIAVVGLHSMLEYPLWYGPFQLALGLCVTLLWRRQVTAGASLVSARDKKKMPGWQLIRAVTAIVLIAMSMYALWDYHRISQIYLPPADRSEVWRDNTLAKIRGSRIFANQVRFAELSTTPLVPTNAQWTFDTAMSLLHYSPEPRVIEKTIESATMLGRHAEALAYLARYKAAFPSEAERWTHANSAAPKKLEQLSLQPAR